MKTTWLVGVSLQFTKSSMQFPQNSTWGISSNGSTSRKVQTWLSYRSAVDNVETSKHRNVESLKCWNVETPKHQNVGTPKHWSVEHCNVEMSYHRNDKHWNLKHLKVKCWLIKILDFKFWKLKDQYLNLEDWCVGNIETINI